MRAFNDAGMVRACPNFREKVHRGRAYVDCKKHGKVGNCEYCPTCPTCGGRTYLDTTSMVVFFKRYKADAMACVSCGRRIQIWEVIPDPVKVRSRKKDETPDGLPPKCAVSGCSMRVRDEKDWNGKGICLSHANQIKTWRTRKLGEDRFPLVVVLGKIVENPLYKNIPLISRKGE